MIEVGKTVNRELVIDTRKKICMFYKSVEQFFNIFSFIRRLVFFELFYQD